MDKIEYPTKFAIDKVLTISLVDKKTGEVVYSAPYDKFAVVLSGVDTMSPVSEEWLKENVLCLKPALAKLRCVECIYQTSLVTGTDISKS